MKRLITAFVLLVIIIAILIVGNICITSSIEKIEALIDKSYKNYESKNYATALNAANELENLWVKKESMLSVFVNKGILEEIGVSIARIKSCAKYQNDDFYSECDTLYVLLVHMKDDENFPFLGVF